MGRPEVLNLTLRRYLLKGRLGPLLGPLERQGREKERQKTAQERPRGSKPSPKPSQNRPKTLPKWSPNPSQNQLKKRYVSITWSNRISCIFDLKIQGFLEAQTHPNKKERSSCRNARDATKPQFLLGFYHFAANTRKTKNNKTKRKI